MQGLDVDALISRFRNLSSLSPTSFSTYESRFRSALASYVSYLENPASYQPRGRRNTSRGDRTRPKGKGMEEPEAGPEEAAGPSPVPPPAAARLVVYPFPVRQDLFAELELPADLSLEEARRLGRFLEAVALTDAASSGEQLLRRTLRSARRQWRFYRTASGNEPIRDFLWDRHLPDEDAAEIAAVMTEVRHAGRAHPDVNHLRGDIWQIEITGRTAIYRLFFAEEGRYHQVLLALVVVSKKWQKAKGRHIELAEQRLADWRERGSRRTPSRSTTAPRPK